MIALADWIESKPKMHHEPESLLCIGLVFAFGAVCVVMAAMAGRGRR